METSAKVIADSISTSGVRITTMELCYQRFIHSEFMTHRMFSRNASSSRAIPVEKMLKQVMDTPAFPVYWGKNQPGMQAREEIECPPLAQDVWKYASELAVDRAYELTDLDVHKQITNRLLEPFQWISVVVTATEWDNFFELRLHKDAQPEIMLLAKHMKEAMEYSIPVELQPGEWHLPYLSNDELGIANPDECLEEAIKWSVARCARVSYLNHDKSFPDRDKDIALADMLLVAGHMSPFEHQATPMKHIHYTEEEQRWELGVTHTDVMARQWSGNFRGWIQYRQTL